MSRRLDVSRNSDAATKLRSKFENRIIGQPQATDALVNLLDKFYGGIYDSTRPIGCLLFLGPTGVGKTASVEAFCEGLYGSKTNMIKIDCGEFQHSHEIAKIIGSPPGYLGHRETHPVFTTQKLNSYHKTDVPFTVILFDEIEKASDALWNLLLAIMDKATLMTGTNEVVKFHETVIIMTSNVGSKEIATASGDGGIGFNVAGSDVDSKELQDISMGAARRKFTPEFLNRFDNIVMFNRLSIENIDEIVHLEIDEVRSRLLGGRMPVHLTVSPAAKIKLVEEGFSARDGARALRRVIEREVLLPIAKAVATGQTRTGDEIVVDYKDGEYQFHAAKLARPKVRFDEKREMAKILAEIQ